MAAKVGLSSPQVDVRLVEGRHRSFYAIDPRHLAVTPAVLSLLDYREGAFAITLAIIESRKPYRIYRWFVAVCSGTLALAGAVFFIRAMNFAPLAMVFALPVALLSFLMYGIAMLFPVSELMQRRSIAKALAATGSLRAAESYFGKLNKYDTRGDSPTERPMAISWSPDLGRLRKVSARMCPQLDA